MQTSIVVNHVCSYLVPDSSRERDIIDLVDAATSWWVGGAQFSEVYRRGHWDGRRHLLSKRKLQFPTGLVGTVSRTLEANEVPHVFYDQREYPSIGSEVVPLEGVTLRGYQVEAVQAGMKYKQGVFKLPPGAGKTEIMVSLVASLGAYPALWITHTRKLLEQTYERFSERLADRHITVGRIGEGAWQPRNVTIATVQTLTSKHRRAGVTELLKRTQAVISDEVHHAPSLTWHRLLMKCRAPFRFGCSATPLDRHDGSDLCLIGSTGDLIYEFTVEEGAEQGVFEVPKVMFVDYDPDGVTTTQGRLFGVWQDLYRTGIVENEKRNQAILEVCKRCVSEGRRVLLLVRMLAHGSLLEEMLSEWFDCEDHVTFIHGSDPSVTRERVIQRFQQGVCRVLIASAILDEGADIPEIEAVVIASGGRSTIKAVQRAGRGMRKIEGKDLVVFDFTDRYHPILLRHSKVRRQVYSRFSQAKVEDWKLFAQ